MAHNEFIDLLDNQLDVYVRSLQEQQHVVSVHPCPRGLTYSRGYEDARMRHIAHTADASEQNALQITALPKNSWFLISSRNLKPEF